MSCSSATTCDAARPTAAALVRSSSGALLADAPGRESPYPDAQGSLLPYGTAPASGDVGFRAANRLGLWRANTDSDEDGVTDSRDQCANSILGPTVVIDSCNSHVTNLASPTGCTLSDEIQLLANRSANHGEFSARVTPYLDQLLRAEKITQKQKEAIRNCASASSIP